MSATIDLAPIRESALQKIDAVFRRRLFKLEHLDQMYAVKAKLAQDALDSADPKQADTAIAGEARLRMIPVLALCRLILARRAEQGRRIMDLELERQCAKAVVRKADSEHRIIEILAEVEESER